MKSTVLFFILAVALAGFAGVQSAATQQAIAIDGAGGGRIFEGIGALSAGASSRLLVDYPEPQRSQILDYLFMPGYGAALEHLKVEIGGDTNSTDGAEPSHMHTRGDLNFHRGYEWWLMKEAKKRNPHIVFDCLPWGAPGWIGGHQYFSADMAEYVARFIEGAKKEHGIDIDYVGIWNERMYDAAFISYTKLLRKTLDAHGLKTRIVAPDSHASAKEKVWDFIQEMKADPDLNAAVYAIGAHYPRNKDRIHTPQWAKDSGYRLWASEDQPALGGNADLPGRRDWVPGGTSLAQLYNRNYIDGRMTKTEIWSPITSYYDVLAAPNSGLMYANTPWSGYYNVQPTIWVTAHTTQFAQPGWRYIDSACGYLSGGGSYVTLRAPASGDYSVIVETVGAASGQRVTFGLAGGLSAGGVHVWRTNATSSFERQADIHPVDGSFTVTLDPNSLYSLTTTTGQGKGTAAPPRDKPFPFPYSDNFEKVALGGTARYLADQNGAFEAVACNGRKGRCLRQVVNTRPISWADIEDDPFTFLGNVEWRDYAVDVDAFLEEPGQVSVLGRIDSSNHFKGNRKEDNTRWPSGYIFSVNQDGAWELNSSRYRRPTVKLASGKTTFGLKTWRRLTLAFEGRSVTALIDGQAVAQISDNTHANGMAGFGAGWNIAQFDNFGVTRRR